MKHYFKIYCGIFCIVCAFSEGVDGWSRRPYYNHPTCPRHPDPVTANRTCLKKCMRNEDCLGSRRRCLCDGQCGNSCIRIGMKCRLLEGLSNGGHEMASHNAFGAIVRYFCDRGYVLSGQRERICQGDGRWSGRPPTCETQGRCGRPPFVEYADHNGSSEETNFSFGSRLTYHCRSGYELVGYHKALCLGEGRWAGPNMNCLPRRCDRPGEIPNGRLESLGFVYESRVNYTCIPGYELLGRPYRVCQADGTWSGSLPLCRPRRCPPPRAIPNGFIYGADHTFGSIIDYLCRPGFKLIGPRKRKCRHDQQWSDDNPVCTLVDCGPLGELYGGLVMYKPSTAFNSTATFKCIQGSKSGIGEEMTSTCLETGTWSHPLPKCWKSCKKPKEVKNSHWRLKYNDLDEWVENGTVLNVNCTKNYVKEFDSVCINGSWSHPPHCVPSTKSCSSARPEEIQNGYFRFYSANHGDRAQYVCDSGFRLVGNPLLYCDDGTWISKGGGAPTCERTECGYPGTISNGEILLIGVRGKFIYRPYVRRIYHNEQIEYQCLKNYSLVGPTGATCVNGSWSPPHKPFCFPKHHYEMEFDRLLNRGRRELPTIGRRNELGSGNGSDVTKKSADGCCPVPPIRHGTTIGRRQHECAEPGTSLRVYCQGRRFVSISVPRQCKEENWFRNIRGICSSGA